MCADQMFSMTMRVLGGAPEGWSLRLHQCFIEGQIWSPISEE